MKNSKTKGGSPASGIADARFASFETDPRFRLPSKKHSKTTIDKRFSRMLKDNDFTATSRVDRYGRKLKSDTKKKALQRLYKEEDEDEDEEEEGEEGAEVGEGDVEVDDDELVQRELRAAHERYDPARGGGFASSESDSDSDDDSEDGEDDGGAEASTKGADMQRFQDEQADVETGEVTNRIAIVNLDWDHVKSSDLMALFSSFLPPGAGRVEKVSVYPSEFGKERMQQEELEGPPKELFKTAAKSESSDEDSEDSEDSDDEAADEKIKKELLTEGNDEDFDSDALRAYQLDRLRYYYAVMVCSSPAVAQKVYEATDGREYQSSSNFIDLRFVPDDVSFDDEPRDECNKVPDAYRPTEFVTNALQSSKVKLTWDMRPEESSRQDSIKRAFSGSRAEIEENDLRAYLASDTEESDDEQEEAQEDDEEGEGEPKLSKKELARRKMREALGLGSEPQGKASTDVPVGDMQITFTPALTESAAAKKKAGDEEETTIEKYKRKERERKEAKRQKARAKREDAGSDEEIVETETAAPAEDAEDLGFNDPFFTAAEPEQASKATVRKQERLKKREAREAAEAKSKADRARLEKVMAKRKDDGVDEADHLDHFDMNEIVKAEKVKTKKGKAKKRAEKQAQEAARGGLQSDFKLDVGDDRFKAVFESHEYAIDPSNPRFKATESMNQLLEEGRKKRRAVVEGDEEPRSKKVKKGRR